MPTGVIFLFYKRFAVMIFAFAFGGVTYGAVETVWRGYTHPTMLIVGGICFAAIYEVERAVKRLPIWAEAVIGAVIITSAELLSGCICNLWLGLNVWDYSDCALNLYGQICVRYSLYWAAISPAAFYLCRVLKTAVGDDAYSASATESSSAKDSSSPLSL